MDIISPVNEERWRAGLTLDEYLASMIENQLRMRRRMEWIRMTPYERGLFARLERSVRVLALTEDDCLDCLMNIPLLAQIQALTGLFEARLFRRSQYPALSAYFARRGVEQIPILLFLDESFQEIGLWAGRPQAAQAHLDEWRRRNPQYAAIQARDDLPPAEKKALLEPLSCQLLEEMEDWYDLGLQLETTRELRKVLQGWIPEG